LGGGGIQRTMAGRDRPKALLPLSDPLRAAPQSPFLPLTSAKLQPVCLGDYPEVNSYCSSPIAQMLGFSSSSQGSSSPVTPFPLTGKGNSHGDLPTCPQVQLGSVLPPEGRRGSPSPGWVLGAGAPEPTARPAACPLFGPALPPDPDAAPSSSPSLM